MNFDVLLTVHLSIILAIDQLNAPDCHLQVWRYQMLYNTIWPPNDEHNSARNM